MTCRGRGTTPLLAGPRRPLPAASIVELMRRISSTEPHWTALETREREVTYGEFWSRTVAIANVLAEVVGAGDRVVLLAHRTPDVLATATAVMSLRAAYVPVDPTHPPARLREIIRIAEPALVVHEGEASRLMPLDPAVPTLDVAAIPPAGLSRTAAQSVSPRMVPPLADDVAYVIFTSGSTGVPKGVQVEHRALLNYSTWCAATVGTGGRGSPLFGSLAFDLSMTSLWPNLIRGQRVVLTPGVWDQSRLFAEHPIRYTFLKATPSHVKFFERTTKPVYRDVTGVLMFGGEALDPALIERIGDRLDGVRLINHYGPTETTVGCCFHRFDRRSVVDLPTVPIGRPIWNTRAYVVDDALRPVAVGTPGELVIAGYGVARGYLGPESASSRFIDESEICGNPGRAYRTGDRVELLRDGSLLYLGREDGQLKVSGFRVEATELRRIALAVDGVADVAFDLVHGDLDTIEAYVVPIEVGTVDADIAGAVRRAFARRLPSAAIPRRVHVVPELKFDANGKCDLRSTRLVIEGGAT